jgi:NAD-dependent dihydropyrimidine dehydrogenase PreA subunit
MISSLSYFGFYKQGCVCPIGSIQNVTLSLFNSHYAVPVTVLIFFGLPLVFALFFGRVFCSSICALGAIQDLVAIKPVQLSRKVTIGLSVIPYAYLGLAVLLAATNTGFLICRYDPFIGFFRLTGNAPYLYLGAGFLLAGVFIARPYCRFFCPYGVLLGWLSRLSRWHLTITPTNCVNCRLCENSCPFDYIHKPNLGLARENRVTGVRRLGYLFLMLPLLVGLCGWVGHRLSVPLSRYNSTVAVAEQILAEKENPALEPTLETKTFRSKGSTESELIQGALIVRSQMNLGGWLVGGFIGLVFGLKLIGFSTVRTQKDYEVDRTHCFSCARCCTYCPNDPGYKANFLAGPPAIQQALAGGDQPKPPTSAPELAASA